MKPEHERFENFLLSLPDSLPDYLRELERKAHEDRVPVIRKGAGQVIRFFIEMNQPKHILEVGTATGFSGLLMAEFSAPDTKITTIEKMEERAEEALLNFKKYDKKKKLSLIVGDADAVLSELAAAHAGHYDFIFMDAAKGQYIHFLPSVTALLKKGGILITDNLLQEGSLIDSKFTIMRRDRTIHKRMREYVHALTESEEFTTMLLEAGDGMSISVKNS